MPYNQVKGLLGNQAGKRVLIKRLLEILVPARANRISISVQQRYSDKSIRCSPLNEPFEHIDEIPNLLLPIPLIAPQTLIFIPDIGIP